MYTAIILPYLPELVSRYGYFMLVSIDIYDKYSHYHLLICITNYTACNEITRHILFTNITGYNMVDFKVSLKHHYFMVLVSTTHPLLSSSGERVGCGFSRARRIRFNVITAALSTHDDGVCPC